MELVEIEQQMAKLAKEIAESEALTVELQRSIQNHQINAEAYIQEET